MFNVSLTHFFFHEPMARYFVCFTGCRRFRNKHRSMRRRLRLRSACSGASLGKVVGIHKDGDETLEQVVFVLDVIKFECASVSVSVSLACSCSCHAAHQLHALTWLTHYLLSCAAFPRKPALEHVLHVGKDACDPGECDAGKSYRVDRGDVPPRDPRTACLIGRDTKAMRATARPGRDRTECVLSP